MAETIELDNLERPTEDTNEIGAEDEEETNLIDDNELNRSIPVPTGFNPDIGAVPNIRRDAGVMERAFVYDKKNFLKEALKTNLNKGDGPNSTILFDNLVITTDQRTCKNNGAKFKNVKIIIIKNNEFGYSSNIKARSAINEFKELLSKAQAEHAITNEGKIEKTLRDEDIADPPMELVESIH